MKPSIAVLLLLAPFSTFAQTPPQQSNSAELPAACRDLPVPAAFEAEAYAIDGDTLAFVGLKPHVRIWGIQAPELRDKDNLETVPGMRLRAALEDLMATAARKNRIGLWPIWMGDPKK